MLLKPLQDLHVDGVRQAEALPEQLSIAVSGVLHTRAEHELRPRAVGVVPPDLWCTRQLRLGLRRRVLGWFWAIVA